MMPPSSMTCVRTAWLGMALLLVLPPAAAAADPTRPVAQSEPVAARVGTGAVLQIDVVPGSSNPATYDLRAVNAEAADFFDRLAEVSGTNMLVRPEVGGRISLQLRQVSLEQVLQAVRDLYSLDFQKVNAGYLVSTAALHTRVFQLNYLDVQRSGVSHTRVSSGQVTQANVAAGGGGGLAGVSSSDGAGGDEISGTSVVTTNSSDFWSNIEADIRVLVGGEASEVVVNRQSGVIVVRAMPAQLEDVAGYLATTQSTVTRQVILEAKIVEVELNSGFQAGINWSALIHEGNTGVSLGQSGPPGGFAADPLTPSGNQITLTPGVPIVGQVIDQLGGAFSLAVNTPDFSSFIELLDSQGRTRVLSSPRVSTLHNQKAVIKAGSDEFFVTGVQSDTTTGTSTTTSLNVELTPFFSGVALDVTPQISDDGTVLLHIHPTVSEVTDQNKSVNFGGGTSNLPLAFSQIRESDSVVRARSGQLIVIGGLMRESRRRSDYRTPGISRVPILGSLFRSKQDQSSTVELVLLLRPLVPADSDWDELAQAPLDRAAELAARGQVEPAQ